MSKKSGFVGFSRAILILGLIAAVVYFSVEKYGGGFDFGKPVAEGTFAENMEWKLSKKGKLTLTGVGAIPDYNGLWMEENELDGEKGYAPWADHMEQITKVVLDPEMTRIGENAFAGAENLKTVERFGKMEEIGRWAFAYTGLESMEFPFDMKKIEPFAFQNCTQLKEVSLPYRMQTLEAGAFLNCTALQSMTIRPQTEVKVAWDWQGRRYLPFSCEVEGRYQLPENLKVYTYQSAAARKFAENYGVPYELATEGYCGSHVTWSYDTETKTLSLEGFGPTWVYSIPWEDMEAWYEEFAEDWVYTTEPDWCYSYKNEIEKVVVGAGISNLNNCIFAKLPALQAAEIPSTVVLLDRAFYGCENLEEITLPGSQEGLWIGYESFAYCTNLKKVEILSGYSGIDERAFFGADHLQEIHFGRNTEPDQTDEGTDDLGITKNAVLYVYKDSKMHQYAVEKGHTCELVDEK